MSGVPFTGYRCPQCGSTLLIQGRQVWCTLVPSGSHDGCDYGIKVPQYVADRYPQATDAKPRTSA